MSDLSTFRNEVSAIQVVSPEGKAIEFNCVLEGPLNFRRWKRELEITLFDMFEPLHYYYRSELHEITDENHIAISHLATVKSVRLRYNIILMAILRLTTSKLIKAEIKRWYKKGVDTDENIAKTIINRLEETYGKMTFDAIFNLVSESSKYIGTSDPTEYDKVYKNVRVAIKYPTLYASSILLCSGTDYVKEEMLRKYGHLTTFEEYTFSSTFRKLMARSPKSSSPPIESNNRQTRRRSKLPPSPCPHCSGNHRKSECPNLPTVADEVNVLSTIYPPGNPAVTDDCAW